MYWIIHYLFIWRLILKAGTCEWKGFFCKKKGNENVLFFSLREKVFFFLFSTCMLGLFPSFIVLVVITCWKWSDSSKFFFSSDVSTSNLSLLLLLYIFSLFFFFICTTISSWLKFAHAHFALIGRKLIPSSPSFL